jgi:alpha-L-fucosidase
MGWPEKEAVVKALGTSSAQAPGKVANVELLGHKGKVQWKQEADGLKVQTPAEKPSDHAIALKVTIA